ncbi:MAG: hypothetical protein DMD35_21645 [Gemmatimonadetes bacterium]|nr:MAG: hypothetical protein DMD35_21645 [Gemmatimonadota bacterium]
MHESTSATDATVVATDGNRLRMGEWLQVVDRCRPPSSARGRKMSGEAKGYRDQGHTVRGSGVGLMRLMGQTPLV